MDLTYQTQLRATNDLNWERFKAELHSHGMELRAEMHALKTELRAEMHGGLDGLRKELAQQDARHHADISSVRSSLIKWMFVFWTGTMLTQSAFMWVALNR